MVEITIEPGGSKAVHCAECGRPSIAAHGCVYAGGDAYAVYFIDWCEEHDGPRAASLTLAVGDWGDDASPAQRRSVCITVRAEGMRLSERPFRDRPDFFGSFLPREQALEHVATSDVWHVADHIVIDDPQAAAVMAWLRGKAATARPRSTIETR